MNISSCILALFFIFFLSLINFANHSSFELSTGNERDHDKSKNMRGFDKTASVPEKVQNRINLAFINLVFFVKSQVELHVGPTEIILKFSVILHLEEFELLRLT